MCGMMQNTPKQWLVSALQYFPVADEGSAKTSLCQVFKAVLPGRNFFSEGWWWCFFVLNLVLVLSDCSLV